MLCKHCCCTVPERVPSFEADVYTICSALWLRERKSNRSRTRAGPCGKLTACSCCCFPALLCNDCFLLSYLPNPRIFATVSPSKPSPHSPHPTPRDWGRSGGNRDHCIPCQLPGKGKGRSSGGRDSPTAFKLAAGPGAGGGRGGRAGGRSARP